ncbi:iron-sulfur cluster assembly protein [Novosphingobium lentum]|uniref:iron-sulfur cluster assembly protein n=1 Tax=Novosphingobium lentum TaxID=145287 RepID=UPI00082CE96F|nr:iron-sulfur cluster assembly protein [Novosphingobium lentum]
MTDPRDLLLAQIHAALDSIPEPCSIAMRKPTSLAGMGLVDAVDIDEGGAVTVTLCLTDPGCVHFNAMQRFIADEIGPLDGVTSVRVVQCLDKLWTPDRVRAA